MNHIRTLLDEAQLLKQLDRACALRRYQRGLCSVLPLRLLNRRRACGDTPTHGPLPLAQSTRFIRACQPADQCSDFVPGFAGYD
jgi:hypothetical protein